MSLVYENISVDIGRVDPFARHVLRQSTTWLDNLSFHWCHPQTFRTFFNSLQCIALGSYGHSKVQIVVSVFQETPVLFIFTRLFCVGDSEEMILVHKPVTQATVLDNWNEDLKLVQFFTWKLRVLVIDTHVH